MSSTACNSDPEPQSRTAARASAASIASLVLLLAAACGGSDRPPADEPTASEPPPEVLSTDDEEDDEVEDGLEVTGLKGRLDPHQIEAGVQPHQSALAGCYRAQLRRVRFLGGEITLKLVVGPDGAVASVQILESDLGSWPVEKCLLEVARSMTFPEPRGGDRHADFTLPLDFNSGRGRVVWWEEEKVAAHVSQKLPELDACEEESGEPAPSNVWVTLYLGNRGAVRSVGFASPSERPIPDAWADCAAEVVGGWALADPLGKIAKTSFRYRPE
ncbi:MAG TPA: AgmX/PglI C-terminal domain-containing protein [Kofleriaceae bacterium]|nr:AgmX/PglI C-terminal domain-containing protein [Kofleriaceae bacterium]